MNKPNKVAVIGLDGLPINLLDHHVKAGHMPVLKKILNSGMLAANSLSVYPTITPPSWTSIATGAWPGTHTVLDFWVHRSGQPLDVAHCPQAFSSNNSKAEYIWDTLDKAGKKCIVLNYPVAWPSKMRNGIMVGGYGMAVGQRNDQIPTFDSQVSLTGNQLFTTGYYLHGVRGEWQPANGWKNEKDMGEDPLEMACQLNHFQASETPAPATWYVLARQTGDSGYDSITLSPNRDLKDAFCTLKVGQWSSTIRTALAMKDGRNKEVSFVCKLIELSDDAESFKLYLSGMLCLEDCCNPPEIARQIKSGGLAGSEMISLMADWFGLSTWLEINDLYTQWHAETAVTLLTQNEWDAFFMHYHSPDWAYHYFMNTMDPDLTKDKEVNDEAWAAHLRMVQAIDRLLEQITSVLPKDALVVIVSDHGEVPDGPSFDPYKALVPVGLARLANGPQHLAHQDVEAAKTFKREDVTEGAFIAAIEFIESFASNTDIKNTKAVPLQTSYVYINLKGRDPDGIVDPADYEKVQRQIIDALYTYVDPDTGKRPVALALSRQDARILGLWGEDCGDVVYATYADVGQGHGNILPTADWGVGTIRNVLAMSGPGIKKGLRMERTCRLVDIVPTICYLLQWPVPAHAEGSVLYQALENPNAMVEEIAELKSGLIRTNAAPKRSAKQK